MLKSVTFEVIGDRQLACEGCEQRVERALKMQQGVQKVRADARSQRIEVLFDAATCDAAAIAERIEKVGYRTKIINPTSA